MESMQRSFGKLLRKGPGDNAKVSAILNDYEDVDKVLAKIITSNKSWRDSWVLLVHAQLQIVTEYESLYDPIVGATDGHGRPSIQTPEAQVERTYKLKVAYGDLKGELMEEINTIEDKVLKPATEARDCLQPIRKTIKNRENKRVDYEKAQEKVAKMQKKPGRNGKEEAALAKAENLVISTGDEFGAADEHLRETLPPIIEAAFRIVPPLLSEHCVIQNRLLGLYYTTLHHYCEELGFPSPAPPMADVITAWNASFRPIQARVESISCISHGKAIHQRMDAGSLPKPAAPAPPADGATPRAMRIPSASLAPKPPASDYGSPTPSPMASPNPGYRRPDHLAPTDFTTATILGGGAVDRSPSSVRSRQDYFSGNEAPRPSATSRTFSGASQVSLTSRNGGGSTSQTMMDGIAKKKPPPPPKPKRIGSIKPVEFVVAQYAFEGQGAGDLSFRAGDRVKIITKTNTDQDWWTGELNGRRGQFPANYCKPA